MKNQYTILILLMFFTLGVFAQTPEKINYQAVARDLSGNPLASQAIAVIIEVRQGSASGADVYKEAHAVSTNAFGLFTLEIGGGTLLGGAFNTIGWGTSSYYLYIEVDGNPIGASQLLSVPYALYAKQALNGSGNSIELVDGDTDTKVMVDSNNTDDDVIHFINAGVEYVTFKQGRIDIHNNGHSVFIGLNSGSNDDFSLNGNVGIGANSLKNNISGGANTAIGENTLIGNISTSGNVAVGNGAISGSSFAGDRNIGIGEISMRNATTAFDNVGVGFATLQNMTTGYSNVAIGTGALENVVGGTSNIAIGYEALRSTLGSGNIAIGEKAGENELGSNKLYIENSNSSSPLIYGDFANDSLKINGSLSIIDGTQGLNKVLTSDANGNASWQIPSAAVDNWGSQVVISSGSNISGNGTAANPLIVTDSVNDADSDPNNERISTFGLNTTGDSLVITEAGLRYVLPLSKLDDGDWIFGPSNRLYNVTHLIGLGTTTPTEKLHIADGDPDLIVQDISGVGNAMKATIAFKDQVGASVLDFGFKPNGATITSYLTGESIIFQNKVGALTGDRMVISGINGYVGIGTSTPNSNLDILGAGTQSNALNINFTSTASTGANNGVFSLVNNTAGGNIHSGYFQVQGSNSSTSSVAVKAFNTANSTLNAGIETSATGTGSTNYGVFSYASGATNNWAGYFGSGAPGDGKVYVQDHLSVGTTSTSSTVNIVGSLQFQDGNQALNKVLTSDGSGNATWQNLPAAPISLWSTTTGSIYPSNITDKVGIGTTAPDVALNIFGSNSSTNINAFNSSPETTIRIYNSSQTNNNFSALSFTTLLSNSASNEMGKIVVQNVNHTIGSQQGDMVFMTRNSANLFERMRIDGNGNVGVGTPTPSAKLDVNGTFKLGATGSVNSKYLAGSVQPLVSALTSSISNNYRTITIPGAVVGDYIVITMAGGTAPQVVLTSASVVGANTVGLNLFNITGAAAPGGTYTFNYIIYK